MARVMVVDDSPTDKDALALVRTLKVDCVVMDVVMPGMNGFQATRTMTRDPATAAIPVIVVSSKSQETDRVWALRQGAREYIVKPVQEAELVGKVQHVLGG
ncbi:MAG TPA: response regulator [Nevskia sp.]|nr:response regulator [Nevskia sp.]